MEFLKLLTAKIDNKHLLILGILLLALGLRLFFFVGININDDTEYCDSAFRIASGKGIHSYPIGSIDSIRFFMVLPVALFYWLFGVSDFTSSLYPLSCSILTILLAYLLAKTLFDWEVAVSTSLMLTLFPLDIVYCTQLVPTVPLACVLTGSLICFVKGDMVYGEGQKWSQKKGKLLFLFSGILLGLGWMINEPAPLFGIVILLYCFIKRRFRPSYFLFIAGALGVFMAESIFFKIMTGDFLWRFAVIHEEEKRVLTNTAMDYYPLAFFKVNNLDFSASQGHFGLFWYLFVGSSIYLLALRKRQPFFLLFGIWLILFYLQFGVMTVTGRPIAKWIRYMEMILPFVTMIVSFSLISFGRIGRARWKGWAVLLLFLLTDLWFIPNAVEANRALTRPMKLIAEFFRNEPDSKPIYIDAGAMGFVDVYLEKKRDIRNLEGSSFDAIQDAYVVINGSRGVIENKDMRSRLPWHGKIASPCWKLLEHIGAPVESACGRKHPLIYYAPKSPGHFQATACCNNQDFNLTNSGSILRDPDKDLICYHSQKMGRYPSFVDIVRSSILRSGGVLMLEMELRGEPMDISMNEIYVAYLWFLDLDQNSDTGQKHGDVGSEFNIRLSRGNGDWGLYVDDNNQNDHYELDKSLTSFEIENSIIQIRLPLKAFSVLNDFIWQVEASVVSMGVPGSIDCHDYGEHDLVYKY